MKAIRFYGPKTPWRLEEVPTPHIGPGDMLVKIDRSGELNSGVDLLDEKKEDVLRALILQ